MEFKSLLRQVVPVLGRGVGPVKCFERELAAAGGLTFRIDLGVRAIPTEKIVGSVGRWATLRPDFFYMNDPMLSQRHQRLEAAMVRDKPLPAIEVYELRSPASIDSIVAARSEYYVLDGHNRVAVAKKLGRAFVDAHVVLYRTSRPASHS